MLYVKLVHYDVDGHHQGFTLYTCDHLHVRKDHVRLQSRSGEDVEINLEDIAMADQVSFFVMNEKGDTIDRFQGSWLVSSTERAKRLADRAAEAE